MKLYNTLSRKVESLKPKSPPIVSVYTCGPTVYDHAHIGHWFTYVRMDLLIRTLISDGFKPKWVMNITDVGHLVSDADEGQDKLEKGAKREGKTAWQIAEFYTDEFLRDMKQLNILEPNYIVKATDHIEEQVKLIQKLEKKDYTYIIDDGVYFDTSKFKKYKDFARLDLDEQQAGARVAINPQKRNQSDFALWKFSPTGAKRDMEWPSPWGKGFPGWHIECSAMSMAYLGETIDIHCGGIDHIPVHHTNEIAQSEAATGKLFASLWMHSNHVMIEGQKISKSLSNGITLDDVLKKGYDVESLRLHILESHYQSQSKFSWRSLKAAENRLQELRAMAVLRYQTIPSRLDYVTFALGDVENEIASLMQDNLNTPTVMAYLSDISRQLLAVGLEDNMRDHFESMLAGIDKLLGLSLSQVKDIDKASKSLIMEREKARQAKDWEMADKLRSRLRDKKIEVLDKPTGPQWHWLI